MLTPSCRAVKLLIMITCLRHSVGDTIKDASFNTPFHLHNEEGFRVVPNFFSGEDTMIKQSFVRLTKDRSFQRGWLWGRHRLGTPDFSALLKVRISGKEEMQHGESLAFFLTRSHYPNPGEFFGLKPVFEGIGVIVDSERDMDPMTHKPRDIKIVVNDGTKTREQMIEESVSCVTNMRHWEGRDDFNFHKSSAIRLSYHSSDKILYVDIDSKNTGRWNRCGSVRLDRFRDDWAVDSFVGITAVTGEDKTNNHDLLALHMYDDANEASSTWGQAALTGGVSSSSSADGHGAVTAQGSSSKEVEVANLIHHMEHEMFAVHDELTIALELLGQAEARATERIMALEDKVHQRSHELLEDRIKALEADIQQNLGTMMGHNVLSVIQRLEAKVGENIDVQLAASSNWTTPLYMLAGFTGAGFIMAWLKYRATQKSHLL